MPRPAKDPFLRSAMCKRLTAALNESQLNDTELSEVLGYATPATIGAMRRGEAFLDSEKLSRLGQLQLRGTAHINLHWVLTGDGPAFLPVASIESNMRCAVAMSELVLKSLATAVASEHR